MPLKSSPADAFGVATIFVVSLLTILGLLCCIYSFYFRTRIHMHRFAHLTYFSGPWVVRITLILFTILWGLGEIARLSFLRREGRALDAFSYKWQENACKFYTVLNLGFAEPCLFLTLAFLLRASLQNMESGTLSRKWNAKTMGHVLLYCLPVFALQLCVILIGPKLNAQKVPCYLTRASVASDDDSAALCVYPLLSTVLLGLFAALLTVYLSWLGRQILGLVINKKLQKRVCTLVFTVSGFLPLRVVLLGLSVLSMPDRAVFEALSFGAFGSLVCCAGVGAWMLVYWPVADSWALRDVEAVRLCGDDEQNDAVSLTASRSIEEESSMRGSSLCVSSDASGKRGSVSFRAMERAEDAFVELSLFSPSQQVSPHGSPQLLGWSPTQVGKV